MKAIFRKVYGVFIGLRWLLGVSHNTDRRSMYRRGYDYAVSELRAGGTREARVLDRYGSLDGLTTSTAVSWTRSRSAFRRRTPRRTSAAPSSASA